MTSSKPSDSKPRLVEVTGKAMIDDSSDGLCPKCGNLKRMRNARPFPVAIQAAFGVSFAAFLWYQSTANAHSKILWAWSVIQIILGALLVRARYASAKKVFICLRCEPTLRS